MEAFSDPGTLKNFGWCLGLGFLGQSKVFGSYFARSTYILIATNILPSLRLLVSKNVKRKCSVFAYLMATGSLEGGDVCAMYSQPGMSFLRLV